MHNIDSNQMKYPSERDKKWARDGILSYFYKYHFSQRNSFIGLAKNEKIEYYIDYLQQHRNAESRIEHALQLCNQSKSVNLFTCVDKQNGKTLVDRLIYPHW